MQLVFKNVGWGESSDQSETMPCMCTVYVTGGYIFDVVPRGML